MTTTTQAKVVPSMGNRTVMCKTPGLAVQLLTAGSAACVADLITFPLDTAKVRLQVQGECLNNACSVTGAQKKYAGVFGTVRGIIANEGPKALYNGIVPGLQRQMAFSAIRIGAYESVKNFYRQKTNCDSGIGFLFVRIAAGITTGTLAIFSAQPTDVVKVRMQAEVKKQGEKPQYKGVIDAYRTIARTEGMKGLYKGTMPNVARNCIINVGEIVVYDIVKDTILSSGYLEDGISCHFLAAATAGFTATLVASPVDVVKTRFMNSPKGRYKGALSCAIETAKNEGFFAFYKGFNASFSRLVSWNICLWLTYEQFKKVIQQQYNQR